MQDHLILLEDILTIQLSELEVQYVDYLIKSYDGVGRFPTKNIFLSKFPECEQMLSNARVFNGKDLNFYVEEFMEKRRARQISSEIMDIASKVMEQGLDEKEATTKTLDAMGSPYKIASQLGAIHRPFWGYYLRVCLGFKPA